VIVLLTFLFLKHFIADFVYQPPFMYQNKGTYGHVGGLLHAGLHCFVTGLILGIFSFNLLLILGVIFLEFIIHYHMDWFKMWYNAKKGWGASTHNEFWVLLGFDQLIHSLTYLLIVGIMY